MTLYKKIIESDKKQIIKAEFIKNPNRYVGINDLVVWKTKKGTFHGNLKSSYSTIQPDRLFVSVNQGLGISVPELTSIIQVGTYLVI